MADDGDEKSDAILQALQALAVNQAALTARLEAMAAQQNRPLPSAVPDQPPIIAGMTAESRDRASMAPVRPGAERNLVVPVRARVADAATPERFQRAATPAVVVAAATAPTPGGGSSGPSGDALAALLARSKTPDRPSPAESNRRSGHPLPWWKTLPSSQGPITVQGHPVTPGGPHGGRIGSAQDEAAQRRNAKAHAGKPVAEGTPSDELVPLDFEAPLGQWLQLVRNDEFPRLTGPGRGVKRGSDVDPTIWMRLPWDGQRLSPGQMQIWLDKDIHGGSAGGGGGGNAEKRPLPIQPVPPERRGRRGSRSAGQPTTAAGNAPTTTPTPTPPVHPTTPTPTPPDTPPTPTTPTTPTPTPPDTPPTPTTPTTPPPTTPATPPATPTPPDPVPSDPVPPATPAPPLAPTPPDTPAPPHPTPPDTPAVSPPPAAPSPAPGILVADPVQTADDGILRITASRLDAGSYNKVDGADADHPYVSGMICSDGGINFLFGYWETRMKVPAGRGLLPFMRLMPNRNYGLGKSRTNHQDVIDHASPPMAVCLQVVGGDTRRVRGGIVLPPPGDDPFALPDTRIGEVTLDDVLSDGFHVFGFQWNADEMAWAIDGEIWHRVPTPPALQNLPMYMEIGLAVAREDGQLPDDTPLPATLEIDYSRLYR